MEDLFRPITFAGLMEVIGLHWGGVSADVYAVYSWDSTLYVGGPFGSFNGNFIKKWVNNQWSTVGENILLGVTYSFAVYDSVLYAGGSGYEIDGNIASGIVRLMDFPDTFLVDTTSINEIENKELIVEIYPNPTTEKLTIQSSESIHSVQVSNLLGEIILNKNYVSGENEFEINTDVIPSGIYFIRVRMSDGWGVSKFVKQ